MKKTLILLFLGVFLSVNAQDKKAMVIEDILTITQTKESIPLIVNSIIDGFKQKRTDIPEEYWQEIKDGVDYITFLDNARKLYKENYNLSELEELVQMLKSGDIDTYKRKSEKIAPQLYQSGNEFGRKTVEYITLKVNNYKG